jgi:ketosteroid isomerase-like protein
MTRKRQTLMRGLVTLAVIACTAGAQERMSGATPEDSVKAAEQVRVQALLRGDTVALSKIVADEFFEISRFGVIRTRADNMREVANGELKLESVRHDSLVVRIYGDVAVLRGIADNTGTYRGTPFTGHLRYTRIFVRRAGRWQAVAMQHTPVQ